MTAGLPLSGRPGDFFFGKVRPRPLKERLCLLSSVSITQVFLRRPGGWLAGMAGQRVRVRQGGRRRKIDVGLVVGWPRWLVRISQRAPLTRQEGSQGLSSHKRGARRHPRPGTGHADAWPVGPHGSIPFSPCKPPDGVQKVRILAGLQIKVSTAVRNQ